MRSVGFLMIGLPLDLQNVVLQHERISRVDYCYKHNRVLDSRLSFKDNCNRNLDIQTYSSVCLQPTKKQRRPGVNGVECWKPLWLQSGQYLSDFLTLSTITVLTTQHNTTYSSAYKQKSAQIWSNRLFLSYICILNLYWLDFLQHTWNSTAPFKLSARCSMAVQPAPSCCENRWNTENGSRNV